MLQCCSVSVSANIQFQLSIAAIMYNQFIYLKIFNTYTVYSFITSEQNKQNIYMSYVLDNRPGFITLSFLLLG